MGGLANFKGLRQRPLAGYALAAFAAWAAYVVRQQVDSVLPPGFPYLTFFPAVILTAFIAGLGPGILCAVLSGLAAWYFFIPPINSFSLNGPTLLALGFYVFVVSVDIAVIHLMAQAVDRLQAERRLTASLYDQQRTMFQELQHRVANNLAFIVSLLTLERRRAASPDQAASLNATIARIDVMARLHRRLYDPVGLDAPLEAHLRDTLRDLVEMAGADGVEVVVFASDVKIELSRLITLSMLVSEVAMNSLKHAFHGRADGRIKVTLQQLDAHRLELTISDNGCGLKADKAPGGGLGSRIVENLGAQLGGKIRVESGPEGVTTRLAFPA